MKRYNNLISTLFVIVSLFYGYWAFFPAVKPELFLYIDKGWLQKVKQRHAYRNTFPDKPSYDEFYKKNKGFFWFQFSDSMRQAAKDPRYTSILGFAYAVLAMVYVVYIKYNGPPDPKKLIITIIIVVFGVYTLFRLFVVFVFSDLQF